VRILFEMARFYAPTTIFMDEIDKISTSEKGVDIQSVLIQLTDPIQNSDFQDKYFAGLSIDISKVKKSAPTFV
jgi:ATP-dependent Lon protease